MFFRALDDMPGSLANMALKTLGSRMIIGGHGYLGVRVNAHGLRLLNSKFEPHHYYIIYILLYLHNISSYD